MSTYKMISGISALALVLGLSLAGTDALARSGANGHGGYHNGNYNSAMQDASGKPLTQEQMDKADALFEEFQGKMQPLRDQIWVKHQELEAAQNASNPDQAAVSKTAQEIVSLRDQMRKEHETFMARCKKDLGFVPMAGQRGMRHMQGGGQPCPAMGNCN